MNKLQRLRSDMHAALKEKKVYAVPAIKNLFAACERHIKSGKELDEAAFAQIVKKEIKETKETLEAAKQDNAKLVIADCKERIKTLEEYMPKQMDEAEIRALIEKTIEEEGLDTANRGLMFGKLMPMFKGKADGKLASDLVKEYID